MRTRRIHSQLAALGLAASLLLAQQPPSVLATAPIEGDTLDFASAADVGAIADDVTAVAFGDLDNDGDLDVVTGSNDGVTAELVVWRNDGTPFNGAWFSANAGNTPVDITSIAVGDLDNDGDLDIVAGTDAAGADPELWAFNQFATPWGGGFSQSEIGQSVSTVDSVALGDLDNDGDLDLISDGVYEISAWENDGSPFGGAWSKNDIGVGTDYVRSVALGDLNGDGLLDVASASLHVEDYEIIAWQNDGTPFSGSWAQTDVGAPAADSFAVAVGDLNNDGHPDIACACGAGIWVWENDGSPFGGGTWAGNLLGSSTDAYRLGLADLDGDGDLDIASCHFASTELRAWQNDGTPFSGNWSETDLGNVTGSVQALALGDLDNDGDADLVSTSTSLATYEVQAWENDHVHRNAPFAAQSSPVGSVDKNVSAVVQGDLDGDGLVDIVSAGEADAGFEIVAWHNFGTPFNGGWPYNGVGQSTDDVNALALGDLDNDGDLDLVMGSDTGADFEIMIWENAGAPFNGRWTSGLVGAPDYSVNSLALADLDNDGDLDIVSGLETGGVSVVVWQNDGTPFNNPWALHGVGISTGDVMSLAAGDLDNDGKMDIVSGSTAPENYEVIAWHNPGSPFAALWSQHDLGATEDTVLALDLGDLDNDGDLDIVTGSGSGATVEILAWENNGNPFGVLWPSYQVGGSPGNVYATQLADLDADGDLDLVTGSGTPDDYEVSAWENDGGALSAAWPPTDIGATEDNVYALALADLDNDGDIDAVSGSGANDENEVMAWKNIGGSARLAPRVDLPKAPILNSNEAAVLSLTFAHNGDAGDNDLELNYLNLALMQPDCTTPLDDTEANALVDNLRVRLDDGDAVFETSDTLVADIGVLALAGGVQTIAFSDGDSKAQVAVGATKTYWLSLLTTSDATTQDPNSLCLSFDPDADALIEAKGTADYSASIQDTSAVRTGAVPIAIIVYVPMIVND